MEDFRSSDLWNTSLSGIFTANEISLQSPTSLAYRPRSCRPRNFTCPHRYKRDKNSSFSSSLHFAARDVKPLITRWRYLFAILSIKILRNGCSLTHFLQLDTDGSCMWAPHCALRPFSFCLVYLCFYTFLISSSKTAGVFIMGLRQTGSLWMDFRKAELSLCVFQNIIKWRKFFSRKLF